MSDLQPVHSQQNKAAQPHRDFTFSGMGSYDSDDSGCCPPKDDCAVDSCGEGCRTAANGCHTAGIADGCGCGCRGNDGGWCLFRSAKSRCSCYSCSYCGKGCNGSASREGVALFGKYQITYASQPSYADPRDNKAWAAPGYGMPMTVPTAPLVRYSYNYSHGTPASRLTRLSTYNPSTSPQPLFLRSW